MPIYRVWYRDIPEPLEFTAVARCSDMEILERIFAQEHIEPPAMSSETSVQELIAKNNLAPVRYTEDESEMNTIE